MRLALLALLLAASAVRAEEPPIGTLVDIGGRKLHLVCMGSGSPTVVFEMEEWRAKDTWPVQSFPDELPEDLRRRLIAKSPSRNWWEARFGEGDLPDGKISLTPEQRKIGVPFWVVTAARRTSSSPAPRAAGGSTRRRSSRSRSGRWCACWRGIETHCGRTVATSCVTLFVCDAKASANGSR
jgi:hypothetical protein